MRNPSVSALGFAWGHSTWPHLFRAATYPHPCYLVVGRYALRYI
jgi:hypothetical protein